MEVDINLALGVITIVSVVSVAIGKLWKRGYSKGEEDTIDKTTHKSLKKEMKSLSDQIEASETRIRNTVEEKVQTADKVHKDFELKFKEHTEDDEKNFKSVHDRIDVTHKRIDDVSKDTSYIRGQIDTFLRKQKD